MADKIGDNARELLDAVGTLVWSIDPRHDRFDDVLTQLKNFAQEMFSAKDISYEFGIQEEINKLHLPLDARKNLLLIFKEAVNNIVKHAKCQNVKVSLRIADGFFAVQISDDGIGISEEINRNGHGIINMRSRALAMGGRFEVSPDPGGGTLVSLYIPLSKLT